MRDPRPGLVWSVRRVAIRARYSTYMASPAWLGRRERWLEQWRAAFGGSGPVCLVCGAVWSLRGGDLHHRSYQRLEHETFTDLVPLCRACHQQVHAVMETQPSWARLGRACATDQIILLLRRHITRGTTRDGR